LKKSFSILLSFLLLLSTVGISVSRHYCGDILKNSAILSPVDWCDDMEMPTDCCHDEIDHYELQDDFQTTEISFDLNQGFALISFYQVSFIDNISDSEDIKYSQLEPPSPPQVEENIYIQVQSFLI